MCTIAGPLNTLAVTYGEQCTSTFSLPEYSETFSQKAIYIDGKKLKNVFPKVYRYSQERHNTGSYEDF